jgi:hypothetical protein
VIYFPLKTSINSKKIQKNTKKYKKIQKNTKKYKKIQKNTKNSTTQKR